MKISDKDNKTKNTKIKYIILALILIILALVGGGAYYISSKLNKVQKVEVNKDNLAINKVQFEEERYKKTLLYLVLMLLKAK
ncbi:hypothetical protein [Clostridium perfringens]|uniref:hypothetical protein n=1 Tax=Clostridium perfringens TaxID=1502 RepID=UPI0028E0DBEF|nr:hypothetical protein [Clostridium perfringens]MDT9331578.1 hypothetical protein [Clostridium perfringens]